MYFYEVFGKCDLEVVVDEFLKLAVDSSDINVTEEVFRGAIKILNEMEPEKSDTEILCIEKIQESGWIDDNVYLLDTTDQKTYAIEASSWANILGCRVDEKSLSDYGNEKFTTLILWEITWFGYDEKTIQDRLLEAIKWAQEHHNTVGDIIAGAADSMNARQHLMNQFGFCMEQAQAIIDMRLRMFCDKERKKISEEIDSLRAYFTNYENVLW